MENSLNFSKDALVENNIYECSKISSYSCNKYKVDAKLDSSSNAICSARDLNKSVPDIEILPRKSDDETNDQKIGTISETIDIKIVNLQTKRKELCSQLLTYTLMDFQIESPHFSADNSPKVPKSQFPVPCSSPLASMSLISRPLSIRPLPIAEEISLKVPPTSQQQTDLLPEHVELHGFTFEDLAVKLMLNFNPFSQHKSSFGAKLPGKTLTEPISQGISTETPFSSSKISPVQIAPQKRFPAISILDILNGNYAHEAEKLGLDSGNIMVEDCMQGDKYVSGNGRRPQSSRYSFKNGAKTSKSESEEPGLSRSDVPEKNSAAE